LLQRTGFEQGNPKDRNSPVDCFGARGRAEESFSFQWAKSPHLRQK